MNANKTHKIQDKNSRHLSGPKTGVQSKQQMETVDELLRGLDALAARAEAADMGMAARIFYTAKEELVHWAVTMHFHESAQDRFINRRLYDSHASAEAIILRILKEAGLRGNRLTGHTLQPRK